MFSTTNSESLGEQVNTNGFGLGLHRWWFHQVREETTNVTDDTNVWRMNQGENHDAEILSVMIRLKRIVRDHELETLLEIIRC